MNRECRYGERRINQLITFNQMELLAWTPVPGKLPRLADPYDESGDLDRRARSYLQVNCSHCHQFNAGGAANIALGIEVPLDQTKTVGVRPIQGTFNIPGARIIAPGDPERSVLYYRISKLGGGRMPRVGSNQVDERATRLIHDWITRMRPAERLVAGADLKAAADDRAALDTLKQTAGVSSEARTAIIRHLASSTYGGLLLMGFLDRAAVSPDLRREVVAIASVSPQVEVRDLFERFIPEGGRIKRLGDAVDRAVLLAMKGNTERGKVVFATSPAAQCKTCHKIGPIGEPVGPDLSKIGTKYDKAALLEHILEPSKTIDPQFVSYLVETKDGQVVTGVVTERTDDAVVLKDAQGKAIKIPRDQVEQLAPQARSLMPELLLRDLTAQQAADLLEFLSAQRAP
jgi:putative heme-binding domain-containing protein